MDALPQGDISQRYSCHLWALWHARRKAVHEQVFQLPHSTHHFIISYIRELEMCRPKKPGATTSSSTVTPAVLCKIKFDGSTSRSSNEGSYNAICRDEGGKYLGSSVIKCACITGPASLESMACREALSLALSLSCDDSIRLPRSRYQLKSGHWRVICKHHQRDQSNIDTFVIVFLHLWRTQYECRGS